MRLILHSLYSDTSKAKRISEMPGEDGATSGIAIRMQFTRVGRTSGYTLSDGTKMAIAAGIGLLEQIDSVVIMMHAYASKLCPQGCETDTGQKIEGTDGAWSLKDLAGLITGWRPKFVFFLCCEFGRTRTDGVREPYTSTDGLRYISLRVPRGIRLLAEVNRVYTMLGMPLLNVGFYARHLVAESS